MNLPSSILTTGHPKADRAERGVALLCATLLGGGALALAGSGSSADWLGLVGKVSYVMLAAAPICIWLTNRIEDVPARSFAGTGARWVAHLQDWLMPGAGALFRLERSGGGRAALLLAVEAMAASDVDLSREIARGRSDIETTAEMVYKVVEQAASVTGEVRATTTDLVAMRETASGLADASCAAQASLEDLSARTTSLSAIADQLHHDLNAISQQAMSLSTNSPELSPCLQAIQTAATSAVSILDTMLSTVARLRLASEGTSAQTEQVAALVLDQSRTADALVERVHTQGLGVASLLRVFETVRSGLLAARESGERASTIEAVRRHAAHTVWQDVATVPGRAETVALLLRSLPAFSPKAARPRATSEQADG